MLKLENLKSAEVVTDLDKAFDLLSKRTEAAEASPVGRKGVTVIERAEDGAIKVTKAGDLSIVSTGDGAPGKPSDEEIKRLVELRGMKWDPEYPKRAKQFWASDERVDAHGDIVRQNWNTEIFKRNPVMPFSHNSYTLGVGGWINWDIIQRRSADYSGPGLWALGVFATPEVDQEADRVFRHVDAGLLRMVSVGFFSKKIIDVKDEQERQALGLGRWGYILDDNHLIEISPTLIGANHGALATWQNAKSMNLLRADDMPFLRELARVGVKRGRGDVKAWREEDNHLRAMASTLFPGIEWREHAGLDEPIQEVKEAAAKRYVPPASTAAAPPAATVKTGEPVAIEDKVAALEKLVTLQSQAIESLKTLLSESLVGVMAKLNDIRDVVEDIRTGSPTPLDVDEEGDGKSHPKKGTAAPGGQEVQPKSNEESHPKKPSPLNAFQRALLARESNGNK